MNYHNFTTAFAAAAFWLLTAACGAPVAAAAWSSPAPQFPRLDSLPFPRAAACNSSIFLRDVTVPDGTPLRPGETFVKKWEAQNAGSCGWNKRYSLRFSRGEPMSGETVYLKKWIPPGGSVILAAELSAPAREGKHEGEWILTDADGTPFGTYFSVKIIVEP